MINYVLLTKPGIVMGNLVTVIAGFLLASRGVIHYQILLATLLGIGFIMASGCVFNNYIDRHLDQKMKRTKERALVTGKISHFQAIIFGTVLGAIGFFMLYYYTNVLTTAVAGVGFIVYVVIYSYWKSRTINGTAIGSIAGAIPPVVGYCSVSNQLDMGAIILFVMMVLWQMPHFFAIALLHFDDYKSARIPVLPIMKGIEITKIHMVIYIIGFIIATALLTFMNYTGFYFLFFTISMGLIWLALSINGFNRSDDMVWGKQMFRVSLIMIAVVSIAIPFDVI
ncbi:MAG: heme o synthase [Parachlamydiaceae bacterium]|nr:heme o synthase [Parachlamydiaceae bacterium]